MQRCLLDVMQQEKVYREVWFHHGSVTVRSRFTKSRQSGHRKYYHQFTTHVVTTTNSIRQVYGSRVGGMNCDPLCYTRAISERL